MKFEDLITELGEFGPFQRKLFFIVSLIGIPSALQTMASVFTQATPQHRCALPNLPNDTYASLGPWHDELVNMSIPQDDEGGYNQCQHRSLTGGVDNGTESCSRWVYSKDPFQSTFVTDLDLVCDKKALVTYASMIMMGGLMGGSLVMGILSDLIGRKKVFILGALGQFAAGFGAAWANSFMVYAALKFCVTFFGVGTYLSAFIIGMELVGPTMRRISGLVILFFWCAGLFMETGIAYGLRNWRHFQMAISMFNLVVVVIFAAFIPESARWLLNKGRTQEAATIIRKAAKENGITLSDKVNNLGDLEAEQSQEQIWHIFSHPVLTGRSLILCFNWLVASMVYYGLSLNAENLHGDIYLNFFLLAVMELASYIFCLLLLDVAGRKFLQCFSMVLGGVACVATLFPVIYGGEEYKWVTTLLSLVGKFGASAGFAVIYIYTCELFPTAVRNSGVGMCSSASRIGGILAPYIGNFGHMVKGSLGVALPQIIFGGLSVSAGLLVLFLPETSNKVLPDSIEDAENFGRSDKKSKNSYAVNNGTKPPSHPSRYNPVFSDSL